MTIFLGSEWYNLGDGLGQFQGISDQKMLFILEVLFVINDISKNLIKFGVFHGISDLQFVFVQVFLFLFW